MTYEEMVLDCLRKHETALANEMAANLDLDESQVRNAIDRLRWKGNPIVALGGGRFGLTTKDRYALDTVALERIAVALERIASALEGER